jgi:hypothetical protein
MRTIWREDLGGAVITKSRVSLRLSIERLLKARASRKRRAAKTDMDELEKRPVRVMYPDAVPISGSAHLALGRTVSRDTINKRFRKAK